MSTCARRACRRLNCRATKSASAPSSSAGRAPRIRCWQPCKSFRDLRHRLRIIAAVPQESLLHASKVCRIGAGVPWMRGGYFLSSACAVQRHELQQPPEHGVAKGQCGVWMRSAREMAHDGVSCEKTRLRLMNPLSPVGACSCFDTPCAARLLSASGDSPSGCVGESPFVLSLSKDGRTFGR